MFNFPYIRRELEAPILRGTLRNRAELILGPRQVGKSTMLDHLVQNQRFIKLTGEDEDDLSILADPKTFLTLTQQFPNVIIDEAQFVPNIGRVIKRLARILHEPQKKPTCEQVGFSCKRLCDSQKEWSSLL